MRLLREIDYCEYFDINTSERSIQDIISYIIDNLNK